ncbi:hypothetical protein GCM10025875_04420 [Litorihabitans aurantiacus]|uniref:SAF domain-containing protein n=1 Tax=Litorihabitans aurantiacus TaxID=1930061 RepID=A0AA37XCX8_9MICO|nr:hypothetical protein GCM10025875_04420 [Litorihabitans aurantiacus]
MLVAIAAWSTIGALRPAPAAHTAVVVPARDLAPGDLLTEGDLATLDLPPGAVPAAAVRAVDDVAGLRVGHPVAAGVPLVGTDLVEQGAWSGAGPGELVVPVRLADPAVASLLPTATPLRLVSATGAGPTLLTSEAVLVSRVEAESAGGLLGSSESGAPLLLLAVPRDVATLVLDASAGGTLTVAVEAGA